MQNAQQQIALQLEKLILPLMLFGTDSQACSKPQKDQLPRSFIRKQRLRIFEELQNNKKSDIKRKKCPESVKTSKQPHKTGDKVENMTYNKNKNKSGNAVSVFTLSCGSSGNAEVIGVLLLSCNSRASEAKAGRRSVQGKQTVQTDLINKQENTPYLHTKWRAHMLCQPGPTMFMSCSPRQE